MWVCNWSLPRVAGTRWRRASTAEGGQQIAICVLWHRNVCNIVIPMNRLDVDCDEMWKLAKAEFVLKINFRANFRLVRKRGSHVTPTFPGFLKALLFVLLQPLSNLLPEHFYGQHLSLICTYEKPKVMQIFQDAKEYLETHPNFWKGFRQFHSHESATAME